MTRTNRTPKVTTMMPIYDSTRQLIQGIANSGSSAIPSSYTEAQPLFGWTASVACLIKVQIENCTNGFNAYVYDKDDTTNSRGVLIYSNGNNIGGTSYVRGTGAFFLSPGDKIALYLDPGCSVVWLVDAYPLKAVQNDIA